MENLPIYTAFTCICVLTFAVNLGGSAYRKEILDTINTSKDKENIRKARVQYKSSYVALVLMNMSFISLLYEVFIR